MFGLLFKFCYWNTWNGDIYPINHGGYISNYKFGVLKEYDYWNIQNITLIDMDLYSNDDLLLTYQSHIDSNPLSSSILPKLSSIIVKVDRKIGITIWAKEILDNSISVNLEIISSFLVNDIAWNLFIYIGAGVNVPGIITKVDIDGNLTDIFYIPFSFNKDSFSSHSLSIIDFYLLADQSFITVAVCTYLQGEFGVSEYSANDFWFFKVDPDRNFKWLTSIDFFNKFEERESLYEYNNTLFVSIVTAKYYYCLLTLDKDTGAFNKWSWNYVYKPTENSSYRMLSISHVSERFIYAYGNLFYDFSNPYFNALYLFDPTTLKLKLVYGLSEWYRFFGVNVAGLNSDAIYCLKYSKLYR